MQFKVKGIEFDDDIISSIEYHSRLLHDCYIKVAAALEYAISTGEKLNCEQATRLDDMLCDMQVVADNMAIIARNINKHGEGGDEPVTTTETSDDVDNQQSE